MTDPLLHMITTADWKVALAAGVVAPPSLAEVGFVHLSTAHQVAVPANALFTGRRDIQLLVLDPDRIGVEVRWEDGHPPAPDGMQFPHAYGPVPTSAVLAVRPYLPDENGAFGVSETPATDAASRAAGFEQAVLVRAATTVVPVTGGLAVLTAEVPRSRMHNQLLVDGTVEAAQLVADADAVLGGAGLAHRMTNLVGSGQQPVAEALIERGWHADHMAIMVAPAAGKHDARVERVDLDDLRPLWAEAWRHDIPGVTDDVITQLADRNGVEERVVDLRYLAVRAAGRPVASCMLKIDGATAWIDAVSTDPEHRGLGHGDALVDTARALAADAGCDLVALAADLADWPLQWYARRGFVQVAQAWSVGTP
ncbi:GNAT family N-acetyltransferase [Pseudonocardia sp. GCM10023141]|uniref:GNAT family N-acetyltransferase n=1 Tax=Pseudonocardia sp. GCM10023141 TaxID=3252653 RepID=UPI0036065F75